MARNYVNNPDFHKALIEYYKLCDEAEDSGMDQPQIPPYIGECFYQIANRLSLKPNFINYPFRDEMIADGLENAVVAATKFDPNRSSNPFAYFTQIIYFAFVRRIQKEKKHLYVKYKCAENSIIFGNDVESSDSNDSAEYASYSLEENEYINGFVKAFEESMEKKRQERLKVKSGIEKFVTTDEENEND